MRGNKACATRVACPPGANLPFVYHCAAEATASGEKLAVVGDELALTLAPRLEAERLLVIATGGDIDWSNVPVPSCATAIVASRAQAEAMDDFIDACTGARTATQAPLVAKVAGETPSDKGTARVLELVARDLFELPAACVDTDGGNSSSSGQHIEVERKFALGEHDEDGFGQQSATWLRDRVESLGGTEVAAFTFADSYWDTADCALCRQDTWLRQRAGRWELKIPGGGTGSRDRSGGETTVFREVVGETAVLRELDMLLPHLRLTSRSAAGDPAEAADASSDAAETHACLRGLSSSLEAAGLYPFAEFGTSRLKLKLPGGVSVDADMASFGHSVLEIEMLVSDLDEVPATLERIESVAADIGLTPLEPGDGGKLMTYIRRFCPPQLDALTTAGLV
jgi:thiamine-triphosphatase